MATMEETIKGFAARQEALRSSKRSTRMVLVPRTTESDEMRTIIENMVNADKADKHMRRFGPYMKHGGRYC